MHSFRWSGRNSFSARKAASLDLRIRIRGLVEENVTDKQFIIAHSHGGNLALLASGDDSIEKDVAGIVCLSTPFLQARLRQLSTAKIASAGMGITVFLVAMLSFSWKHWIGHLTWPQAGAIMALAIPANTILAKLASRPVIVGRFRTSIHIASSS
ncbi:MAG TPA: hypothetical protein VIT22_00275 [Pseudoxanthomonas sp.]